MKDALIITWSWQALTWKYRTKNTDSFIRINCKLRAIVVELHTKYCYHLVGNFGLVSYQFRGGDINLCILRVVVGWPTVVIQAAMVHDAGEAGAGLGWGLIDAFSQGL